MGNESQSQPVRLGPYVARTWETGFLIWRADYKTTQTSCSMDSAVPNWLNETQMKQDESNWRDWPLAERERQYSPSSCVPALAPYLDAYAARSREAEQRCRCLKNLRWGEQPDETFDYFPAAAADAPLLVFFHGGYWQELSKGESLFAAPGCVANGIAFAALDYRLAPKATLGTIVDQSRRAIASLHRQAATLGCDPRRIHVCGSSAGAHLAAMLLVDGWQEDYGLQASTPAVTGAVLLSGIYDLDPLVGTYIDEALHLSAADVATLSPARLPLGPPAKAIVAWGENETSEFKRQSCAFASKLQTGGFPVSAFEVAGANHFEIVFGLADTTTHLGSATVELIRAGDDAPV
jgi:arylformamidase